MLLLPIVQFSIFIQLLMVIHTAFLILVVFLNYDLLLGLPFSFTLPISCKTFLFRFGVEGWLVSTSCGWSIFDWRRHFFLLAELVIKLLLDVGDQILDFIGHGRIEPEYIYLYNGRTPMA